MANTIYQKLEYLDNGKAGNVIDINLKSIGIYGFDITCSFPVASTPKAALWGHRTSSTNCYKFIPMYTATSIGYQNGSTYYSLTSHTIELNAKYRFMALGGSLRPKGYQMYKNDVLFFSKDSPFTTTVSTRGIHLYATNDDGNFKLPIRARIYNAKFYLNYSNTTIGRDLIPAKRVSDGVCGLFDIISKEFYTSLSDTTKYEFTGSELNEYFDENYNSVVPATLEEKLEHINETKLLIKQALVNKGIEISDTDTFRSYAGKINNISTENENNAIIGENLVATNTSTSENNRVLNNLIIKIPLIDTSGWKSTVSLFYGCINLEEVPQLDTSNVTNMNRMFYNCKKITRVPLLNTSNVVNTTYMFKDCEKLIEIQGINTSLVTTMNYMFDGCTSLETIPELDMSSAKNISYLFTRCTNLRNINGILNLGKAYTQATEKYSAYELDLSGSTGLTYASLLNVINGLYDLNLTYDVANGGTLYKQSCKLGETNLAKLTSEEIEIATNKGWILS